MITSSRGKDLGKKEKLISNSNKNADEDKGDGSNEEYMAHHEANSIGLLL